MPVQEGDKVAIEYTGRLPDGTVFDTNKDKEPLEFTVGSGEVIDGFDKRVRGLEPGKQTQFKLDPEEAYGQRDEKLVIPVNKEAFGEQEPEPGMSVGLKDQEGNEYTGRITDTQSEQIMVDLNHPLAGQTLEFEVEVVDVKNE